MEIKNIIYFSIMEIIVVFQNIKQTYRVVSHMPTPHGIVIGGPLKKVHCTALKFLENNYDVD